MPPPHSSLPIFPQMSPSRPPVTFAPLPKSHSTDRLSATAADPRRINSSHIPFQRTTRHALKLSLVNDPTVHILLRQFTPRAPRWRPVRTQQAVPLITLECASALGRPWRLVAKNAEVGRVVALACPPGRVESMYIRITVAYQRGGVETEAGRATVVLMELLDAKRRVESGSSAGSDGSGGAFEVEVRDERGGSVSYAAGVLELRAVVAGRVEGGGRVCMLRDLGLGLEVCCGIAMRREVKGVLLRVSRRGGGRQMLPLADMKLSSGGVGYGSAVVGKELLWFGIKEGGVAETGLRLEWWRVWGMFVGKRHVVGRLDVGMRELEGMRGGESRKIWWQAAPAERKVTRLVLFDEVVSAKGRVWIKLRLTQ